MIQTCAISFHYTLNTLKFNFHVKLGQTSMQRYFQFIIQITPHILFNNLLLVGLERL